MATETVSFRLKKELKELAKKHNIDISRMAKEKVEEELAKLERKQREEVLDKAANILSGTPKHDIVAAVRKGRESR